MLNVDRCISIADWSTKLDTEMIGILPPRQDNFASCHTSNSFSRNNRQLTKPACASWGKLKDRTPLFDQTHYCSASITSATVDLLFEVVHVYISLL